MGELRRINCGCGRKPQPGYTNVDLVRYPGVCYDGAEFVLQDLARGLPEGGPWDLIEAKQFLEHLSWQEGQAFLGHCRAGIAPGGVLHLTVPDLDAHLEAIRQGKALVPILPWLRGKMERELWPFRPEENTLLFVLYSEGHRCAYNESILRRALEVSGWRVRRVTRPDGANLDVLATPA